MCDNKDTTASLGNSEVLSVKHPVGPPIPEFCQSTEELSESISSIGKDAGDVFPDHPAGAALCNEAKEGESEVPAWVSKALSKSCDAKGLAGCSSDKSINCWDVPGVMQSEIAEVGDGRVVMREDGAGECRDFRKGNGLPPERMPGDSGGFDARADGEVAHG